MPDDSPNEIERMNPFAQANEIELQRFLRAGYDGSVFAINRKSAVKAFRWNALYQQERDVYLRLRQHKVGNVAGCHVPRLITFDDTFQVVEMTIVSPPYVLDFAGARLGHRTEFPDDVRRQWVREKRSQFGSNWKYIPRIVVAFEQMGIHLSDLNPGNICLTGYNG